MPGTTYMDKSAVRRMSNSFETTGEVLKGVDVALQAAIELLNTTAFVGMVGGAAITQYLNVIQPRVKRLSGKCTDMGQRLSETVELREQAEAVGDSI